MYMGFLKMGVSLMGLFFGLAMLGGFFGQSIFLLADVVVWFYAFFHAHNLRAMDDEEFYALEDDYLFHLDGSGKEFWTRTVAARYRKLAAAALILIGASILWNNLLDFPVLAAAGSYAGCDLYDQLPDSADCAGNRDYCGRRVDDPRKEAGAPGRRGKGGGRG